MGGANLTPSNAALPQAVRKFPYNSTPPFYVFTLQSNPAGDPAPTITFPLPFTFESDPKPGMVGYPVRTEFNLSTLQFSAISGNRLKIPRGLYRITLGGGYTLKQDPAPVLPTDQLWAEVRLRLRLTSTISLSGTLDTGVGNDLSPNAGGSSDVESLGWCAQARITEPIIPLFIVESGVVLDAAGDPTPLTETADLVANPLSIFISAGMTFEMIGF